MQCKPIRTHRIEAGEVLPSILDLYVPKISEGEILVITSKIISICEGSVVSKTSISKKSLVKKEADAIVETLDNPYDLYLTIKNNILIPSAGVDESNADNVYILYPKNVQETAIDLWNYLRQKHGISNLGILITDSHTMPMRRGVTGICLGWCGFEPLYSYIGKPDIYGKTLRVTQINLLDALATSAVLVMGEGDEQMPLAVITEAPKITFLNRPPTIDEKNSIIIPIDEDLYAPLLSSVSWLK